MRRGVAEMRNNNQKIFSRILRPVIKASFILILTLILVPSAWSLWFEKTDIRVSVTTGGWTVPRSHGYWKHQFHVYLTGRGSAQEDNESLAAMLTNISNRSACLDFDGSENVMFQQAYVVLSNSTDSDARLRRELLTLYLNMESGYADGKTMTLSNNTVVDGPWLTSWAENILAHGSPAQKDQVKDVVEEFNTRWES